MCSQPGYIPKWKCTEVHALVLTHRCAYPDCVSTTSLITPKFDTLLNLELAINIETSANTALLLCPKHYREVHRKLKSPAPCASCGAKPKRATYFTRHTPATDTTTINKILCDVSGEDAVAISVDDCICGSCYKAHLAIVRSIQEAHEHCDINDLIKIPRHRLGERDINNVTRATLHVVRHVANEILNERAVTLPCLCRLFLNVYTTNPEYAPYIRYGQYRMRNRYYSRTRMNIYVQLRCARSNW